MEYVIYIENDLSEAEKGSRGELLYKYLRNQIKSDKAIKKRIYVQKRTKWRNYYALISRKGAPEISKRTFVIRVFIRKKSLRIAFRGVIDDPNVKKLYCKSVTLKPQFKTVLKLRTKDHCDVVFKLVKDIVLSMVTLKKKGV